MKLRQPTNLLIVKSSLTATYNHFIKFEMKLDGTRKRHKTFLAFWRLYFKALAPLLSKKNSIEKIDLINLIFANAIMKTAKDWADKEDFLFLVSLSMSEDLNMQKSFLKGGGIHQINN